jgi:DNA-binding PadR family transcriptional regulator
MWAHGWGSWHHRGLRVWVLNLLERGPMNGVEIMEQMDRMTMGWWRPSPGSVYPLLEQLEREKLVTKGDDGRYRLTEEARAGPDWIRGRGMFGAMGPRDPEDAARELESYIRYLEDAGRTDPGRMGKLKDRLRAASERLDRLAQDAGKAA